MTIENAYNFFESLQKEKTKKAESKIFKEFLRILSSLKLRDFSKDEILSIETQLDDLNLEPNPKNRKKYFKKALNKFETHLEESLSLTSKDYYTKLGIVLGATFGMLIGVVFLSIWERSLGISMGMIIGSGIGGAIGRSMDNKAMSENRVI